MQLLHYRNVYCISFHQLINSQRKHVPRGGQSRREDEAPASPRAQKLAIQNLPNCE